MQTTQLVLHSPGSEILRSLFKHWIGDRFPVLYEARQQDNIQDLRFRQHGRELRLIMNMAYLRDKTIPCALIRDGVDDQQEHDLLDPAFLDQLEVLLDPFRPAPEDKVFEMRV